MRVILTTDFQYHRTDMIDPRPLLMIERLNNYKISSYFILYRWVGSIPIRDIEDCKVVSFKKKDNISVRLK